MRTQIFIHVGIHKTGTTFLQKEVFPKIAGINYVFRVGLDTTIVPGKINLLSDENLDGGSYRLFNSKSRYDIAINLHKMYPSAKIIICIRSEFDWLKSAWKQYTLSYYGYSFGEYCYRLGNARVETDGYIIFLRTLFDDVLVCDFEDLKKDPKAFVKRICDFMGVEAPEFENKKYYQSITDGQAAFIVFYDKIFRSKTMHFLLSLLVRFVRKDEMFEKWSGKKV